jgi:hypothetical protein
LAQPNHKNQLRWIQPDHGSVIPCNAFVLPGILVQFPATQ